MSQTFKQPPSKLLQLDDPYVAFCLDEACFLWGRHVEHELDLAARDPKDLNRKEYRNATSRRTRTFEKLMNEEAESQPEKTRPGRYRDPATMFSSKRK